jgi:protease-4
MSDTVPKEGFFSRWGRRITSLRNFVVNSAFLLFFVLVLSALLSTPDQPEISADSALFIAPNGTLVEQITPPSDWRDLIFQPADRGLIEVGDVLKSIDLAAQDDRITMLALKLDQLSGLTSSRAISIGERIKAFRETGKTVVAYTQYSGQFQYLAASYADQVLLHPMGSIMLSGLGGDRLYFADMLEKLKVKMHIFRVGEYKSATEPFSRNAMSDAARQDSQRLVDGIWQTVTNAIASNRGLSTDAVSTFANNFDVLLQDAQGDGAKATLDSNLVDGLATSEEFRQRIGAQVGWQDDSLNGIDFQWYLAMNPGAIPPSEQAVGVITVQGAIMESGLASSEVASAEALVEQIRMAKNDERIKALVLRVDSPGGSAFASELIREELLALQATGKPVVASFATVAASGGYWISASADAIFAEPTTITGSIGIFGILPNVSESLGALGIHADGVSSAPLARGLSVVGDLSDQAKNILQLSIEHGYAEFIDLVVNGRGMTQTEVEAIAQGRVWSGLTAKSIGLVDELGGLQQAADHAAALAGLTNWTIEDVRMRLDPQSLIMMELMQATRATPVDNRFDQWTRQLPWLGPLRSSIDQLSAFNDPRHVYAMCLSCAAR